MLVTINGCFYMYSYTHTRLFSLMLVSKLGTSSVGSSWTTTTTPVVAVIHGGWSFSNMYIAFLAFYCTVSTINFLF